MKTPLDSRVLRKNPITGTPEKWDTNFVRVPDGMVRHGLNGRLEKRKRPNGHLEQRR